MAVEETSTTDLTPVRGELDLVAGANLLLRHARFILLCGAACFVVMLVAMLIVKPRYASQVSIVIPQINPAAGALKAELGAVGAPLDLAGGGYELYADILKSFAVRDGVINACGLMQVYKARTREIAEDELTARTVISTTPEGLISLSVQDEDKDRAAAIANEYVHQLERVNSGLVLTSVAQERLYLERELASQKVTLEDAETDLAHTTEGMRGVPPTAEATAGLTALESTRAQLRVAQVQLAAKLTGETDSNPEVVRLRSEIARLAGLLADLQHGQGSDASGTPTSQLPEETLLYERRAREVKFQETLFDLLSREYEEAKMQEAKSPNIVQVLDAAVPAEHKAWPHRTVYCLVAAIAGLAFGVFLVLMHALYRKFTETYENRQRLQELKQALSQGVSGRH